MCGAIQISRAVETVFQLRRKHIDSLKIYLDGNVSDDSEQVRFKFPNTYAARLELAYLGALNDLTAVVLAAKARQEGKEFWLNGEKVG